MAPGHFLYRGNETFFRASGSELFAAIFISEEVDLTVAHVIESLLNLRLNNFEAIGQVEQIGVFSQNVLVCGFDVLDHSDAEFGIGLCLIERGIRKNHACASFELLNVPEELSTQFFAGFNRIFLQIQPDFQAGERMHLPERKANSRHK